MAETERTTEQMAAVSDNRSTLGEPLRADRPWDHLGDVLKRASGALVMTALLALATPGCSVRVETESAHWTSPASVSSQPQVSTGENARTAVEVALLQPRSPQPIASPKPPEPLPPPKPVAPAEKPLTICDNTFVLNFRGGDTHNETHVHIHEAPPPRVEETVIINRKVKTQPRRPVDERCERMAREHEERVRRWKAFPQGF